MTEPCPLCGKQVMSSQVAVWHDVPPGRCPVAQVKVSHAQWTELVALIKDGLAVRWIQNQDEVKLGIRGLICREEAECKVWDMFNDEVTHHAPTLHEAVLKAKGE